MPIYCYECSHPRCMTQFEEFYKINENSGKTLCPRCGNTAFKIPAIFTPRIFKQRVFADGTKTPNNVNTPSQEKAWMKSQGITYDKPTGVEKRHIREERQRKSETAMSLAFRDAVSKVEQGYKVNSKAKEPKKLSFQVN